MRTFKFLIHLMYHLKSGVLKWTESSLQMGRAYQHYDVAKQQIKAYEKSQTGITMDAVDQTGKGGSTNKGDVCKRLVDDHREVLVNCVDVRYQNNFRELIASII